MKTERAESVDLQRGEPAVDTTQAMRTAPPVREPRMPRYTPAPIGQFRHHRGAQAYVLGRVCPFMGKPRPPRPPPAFVLDAIENHISPRSIASHSGSVTTCNLPVSAGSIST